MYLTSFLLLYCVCFTKSTTTPNTIDIPEKCLVNIPEIGAKRYGHYMEHHRPITVLSSKRPLHRITTEIFKIWAMEVLGYSKVVISEEDDKFDWQQVTERLTPDMSETSIFPSAMVNLEVWVPPDVDLIELEDTQLVREFGNVGPPGRFGWFIPEDMQEPIKRFYKNWTPDIREVHWTFLRERQVMALFNVAGKARTLVERNAHSSNSSCMDPICKNGIYSPPQCSNSPCGLLLAGDYNLTSFAIDHILRLKLLVQVAWLGDNLESTIEELRTIYKTSPERSLLILHYTPSAVVLRERDFLTVAFSQCDTLNTSFSIGCKYEHLRLVKMSWNKIKEFGLQQALRSFRFGEDSYDDLLNIYEKHSKESMRQVACEWMRTSERTWSVWKAETDEAVIYIGGVFPITNSSYNGPGIVRGALLAQNIINNSTSILPNHKIRMLISNGRCRPDTVMKTFIEYIVDGYYNQLAGVLGPACSDAVEPLAGASKYYRMMVISYSAEGSSFSDRAQYPYFFRTIGENKHYTHVYMNLFKQMGWGRVAALSEDGQKYTEYISHMQQEFEEHGVTFIANTKFPRERQSLQMTRYLEELKRKTARIIILDVFDEVARSVMCEAYHMGMTPADGYVWFLPSWLNSTWYDTDYFNTISQIVNCTTTQMMKAATGYFSMRHAFYAPDDSRVQGNMTVREWKDKYNLMSTYKFKNEKSDYAAYAYDAMWTYALALDQLISTDPEAASDLHTENNTQKLLRLIEATDFNGVSGRIKFRGGPSRFSNIDILEWYDNQLQVIGTFYPNLSETRPEIIGGRLDLAMKKIRWFTPQEKRPEDGRVPEPQCTFNTLAKALNVSCEVALVIVNFMLATFLLVMVGVVILRIKRSYDKKVRDTEKYMRHFGIDIRLNTTTISDLDKWEIARNSVVINRKLGEGAFGTVYGGEANFPDKGWMAVAVKTLKVGSTTEEKLDFLSEAEVMKRFEHKNIIKLLGVCTKEEPIYTIMEFMLYGDLKTFLLARRHLVTKKTTEESDEISSKRLTAMALDVARGLSYLAQLKYVHRDVASRNCLINAQRVVKLGDFGMTRPMFNNDYYKFTRKGMLPVRWMSPESLALGVFTPASDVWSFGILLYEIITFGSFPYQGMNNSEVLDYVKEGHTIIAPAAVKPQLKVLLNCCWLQDPRERMRSSEIVEFLANNPRLLAPCLDVPLASVQLEESGQLEITLPDQFRKCSAANIQAPASPGGGATVMYTEGGHGSTSDSGVSLPLENCCPKEPLLGTAKSQSSLLNFGKYVGGDVRLSGVAAEEDEDDYMNHNPGNGYVVSKV